MIKEILKTLKSILDNRWFIIKESLCTTLLQEKKTTNHDCYTPTQRFYRNICVIILYYYAIVIII